MPDWSYQSLFRPLLFKLPARVARAVTLRAMGGLSAIPGGSLVIRTLGHMEVSPLLRRRLNAIDFTYPVGLSGGTDPHGNAHGALAQFGLGFLEIGPVTVQPILHKEAISRDSAREALVYPDRLENDGLEAIAARMKRKQGHKLPVFFRICAMPGSSRDQVLTEFGQLLDRLGPYAAGFYLDFLDESRLQQEIGEAGSCTLEIMRSARSLVPGKPLFIYIPLALPDGKLTALVRLLGEHGLLSEGIVLGDGLRTAQGYEIGASAKAPTIDKLNLLKRELPDSFTLIAA
ncbi:hypothetical protein K0U00_18090, partial [Paenibacillus sepulcri]|nr:hypothetical protein [Paenibacillus sepulcri]